MEILVQPLGQRLDVRPGENLLAALQASQVPISYSCLSGRCGTCRCKVVEGDIHEHGGYAFHHGDHQPERHVLACQSVVTGPCVIEIPEPDEVVIHTARIVKATVTAIENLTHDIRMIRLKPSKPLAFSPGQYATLRFTPDHIRPYSMARIASDYEMEFHVRLVPDGRVTTYIRDVLKVGDAVRISGPLGTSYLRTRNADPILCVAGGTGLAPVLSIIRGAIEADMRNPIHLYFGVRSPRDAYGLDWLRQLSDQYPNLKTEVVASLPGERDGMHANLRTELRTGLVTEAVGKDFADLSGWRSYLCGAPPMVEAATRLLRQKGVKPEHIYADAFYASGT
ncbi:2Fe-2S iron-sulfur cluster-binding protein [Cupriavidus sp. RAF12]|uniref:2Fe-2S iron-sulfur cluster-binding protein n=1 Tax=Cupriavidus sp. RAF12 TaxID=3233050 RepID=UPI003F8F8529